MEKFSRFLSGIFLGILSINSIACDPECVVRPEDNKVTFSTLGQYGRFGNQVYQYIFIRGYAKRHHLEFETRGWIGKQIYGFNDPEVTVNYCPVPESDEVLRSYAGLSEKRYSGVDFTGVFLGNTSYHRWNREEILKLFQPLPEVKAQLQPGLDKLRQHKTVIGIHIRRGDFVWIGKPPFNISPTTWYVNWLKEHWNKLEDPVVFLASDSLKEILPDFAEFHPETSESLGIKLNIEGADFYSDHYLLSNADIMLLSNSTFSTSAALLNQVATDFMRPDFSAKKLVHFDPWSTYGFEFDNQ